MDFITIYALTIIPNLAVPLNILGLCCLIFTFGCLILWLVCYFDGDGPLKQTRKCSMISATITIVLMIVAGLIPSERQMYAIIGGYYVSNIDGVDKLPKNTVKAMNKFLEKYSEEYAAKGTVKEQ